MGSKRVVKKRLETKNQKPRGKKRRTRRTRKKNSSKGTLNPRARVKFQNAPKIVLHLLGIRGFGGRRGICQRRVSHRRILRRGRGIAKLLHGNRRRVLICVTRWGGHARVAVLVGHRNLTSQRRVRIAPLLCAIVVGVGKQSSTDTVGHGLLVRREPLRILTWTGRTGGISRGCRVVWHAARMRPIKPRGVLGTRDGRWWLLWTWIK